MLQVFQRVLHSKVYTARKERMQGQEFGIYAYNTLGYVKVIHLGIVYIHTKDYKDLCTSSFNFGPLVKPFRFGKPSAPLGMISSALSAYNL